MYARGLMKAKVKSRMSAGQYYTLLVNIHLAITIASK